MVTNLGWGDPVQEPVLLLYRRKGAEQKENFRGPIYIVDLGTPEMKLTPVARVELPAGPLDLTRVPVIGIGGKRKYQPDRVREFLGQNPGFSGAFLLYPGSGNWDLGEGMLFVTSHEVLEGQRISGGRPEIQLTNFRWERDGRYVADRAKMLHGKVLETIETSLEQAPGTTLIAEAMLGYGFEHPLKAQLAAVLHDLHELEERRISFETGQAKSFAEEVKTLLVAKLEMAGVRRVSEIPAGLTITAEEIAPELTAQRETLGTVEIPGLGRWPVLRRRDFMGFKPYVAVTLDDVRQITNWPFTNLDLRIEEVDGNSWDGSHWSAPIFQEGDDRWPAILKGIEEKWVHVQRSSNWPKDSLTGDPCETGVPILPDMVKWGEDFSGQTFFAFPAYSEKATVWVVPPKPSYGMGGGGYNQKGWGIKWFNTAEEAVSHNAEARYHAEDLIRQKRLEDETQKAAEGKQFPLAPPEMAEFMTPTLAEIMEHLGFKPGQFRIEAHEPRIIHHPGVFTGGEGWLYDDRGSGPDRNDSWSESWNETFLWEKDDDGVLVIYQSATLSHLMGSDWYDSGRCECVANRELGVTKDTILAAREWIRGEQEKVVEENRCRIRVFLEAVRELPAYACLPKGLQEKLAPDSFHADPDRIEGLVAELHHAWLLAEGLLVQQLAGQVLVNFEAWHRRGGASNRGDGWVVRPDGSCRQRDSSTIPLHKSDGMVRWDLVQPDELALIWRGGCSVAHLPANGLTSEQRDAVREIETEIGVPEGVFGLDPTVIARNAQLAAQIVAAAKTFGCLLPEDFYHLLGGVTMDGCESVFRKHGAIGQTDYYDNREANVVKEVAVAGGVLRFMLYEKYGDVNYAARWQPVSADLCQSEPVEVVDHDDPRPVDLKAAVSLLSARFNGLK